MLKRTLQATVAGLALMAGAEALACGHYQGITAANTLNNLFGDMSGVSVSADWQDGGHAMSFTIRAADGSTASFGAYGRSESQWINDAVSFLQDHMPTIEESDAQDDYAG